MIRADPIKIDPTLGGINQVLSEKEFAKIKVKKGAVVITDWDCAVYLKRYDDIVLISIDCSTKYIDAYNSGYPSYLVLTSNERSLYLNPDVESDEETHVYFEEHLDWDIKFVSTGRYTVEVLLVKNND